MDLKITKRDMVDIIVKALGKNPDQCSGMVSAYMKNKKSDLWELYFKSLNLLNKEI